MPQIAKDLTLPVPLGLNTADPASDLGLRDAALLYNMIAAEQGLRSRLGFVEWCVQVDTTAYEIRTILPYKGSSGNDRLWAVTKDGIYPATASVTNPAQSIAFGSTADPAGYGNGVSFVTTLGVRSLLYTDEANGYYLYPEGGPWAKVAAGGGAGQVSGADPATFAQVIAFKSRAWFVAKNTTQAWYLGIGATSGAATLFDFGQQFPHGGNLACLYSWTVDGGAGADDILVAIGTGGDVVLYQGIDPSSASTWQKIGSFYIGAVPVGRRLATAFGGDLLLLSSFGVLPLSRLTAGRSLLSPDIFSTYKIRNQFNALMADRRNLYGWSIVPHPADNTVLVTYPPLLGEQRQQYASATAVAGWSLYQGLPIVSADSWNGDLYFGTADGRVCVNKGFIDNVKIDGTTVQAVPIFWGGITAFRSQSGARKMVNMVRARGICQGAVPGMLMQARYDFDTTALLQAPPAVPVIGNAWDTALWDATAATFAGSSKPFEVLMGATGCGTYAAVVWAGVSVQRISLIQFDLLFEQGGFL
jgi:hypothetical protein